MTAMLMAQPQEGGMVVDFDGNIRHAAIQLGHQQNRWKLRRVDGTGAGTRHANSLSTGVWLSNQSQPGVVFVRSDSGGMHVFFGGGGCFPPAALFVNERTFSRQVPSYSVPKKSPY